MDQRLGAVEVVALLDTKNLAGVYATDVCKELTRTEPGEYVEDDIF